MIKPIVNREHFETVLRPALAGCRRRLFIATADLKDVHVPGDARHRRRRGRATSAWDALSELATGGVEVHVLHAGVPSGPLMERLRDGLPAKLCLRRCVRMHAKAVIVDSRRMYLGSANFTGAGLGAKSPRRRNFEAGVWTDETALIDPVMDMLQAVWSGEACGDCGRRDHCPAPLEEPDL